MRTKLSRPATSKARRAKFASKKRAAKFPVSLSGRIKAVRKPAFQEVIDVRPQDDDREVLQVTLGTVTYRGFMPKEDMVRERIAILKTLLASALQDITRPGIQSPKRKKNVAFFRADPENPALLIREFNGQTQRGVLEHGIFRAI